jgi:hypothetical protein
VILHSIQATPWDEAHFKLCGVNPAAWLTALEQKISVQGQAEMIMRVEKNQLEKKMTKLSRSSLR